MSECRKNIVELGRSRWKYGAGALHAGDLRLQTQTQTQTHRHTDTHTHTHTHTHTQNM